jgi:hypothetical protein
MFSQPFVYLMKKNIKIIIPASHTTTENPNNFTKVPNCVTLSKQGHKEHIPTR